MAAQDSFNLLACSGFFSRPFSACPKSTSKVWSLKSPNKDGCCKVQFSLFKNLFKRGCPEMTSLWLYLIRLTPPPPDHFLSLFGWLPPPPPSVPLCIDIQSLLGRLPLPLITGLAPIVAIAKARRKKMRGIKTKEETQGSSVRAPPRSPVWWAPRIDELQAPNREDLDISGHPKWRRSFPRRQKGEASEAAKQSTREPAWASARNQYH